jgi:hypothetical protein
MQAGLVGARTVMVNIDLHYPLLPLHADGVLLAGGCEDCS